MSPFASGFLKTNTSVWLQVTPNRYQVICASCFVNTVTVVIKKPVASRSIWDNICFWCNDRREIDTIVIARVPGDLFHFGTVIQQVHDIWCHGFCLENGRASVIEYVRLCG